MRIKAVHAIALGGLLFAVAPTWAHHAFEAEFDQNKQWTIAPTISFAVTPPHSRGGAAAGGGGAGPD